MPLTRIAADAPSVYENAEIIFKVQRPLLSGEGDIDEMAKRVAAAIDEKLTQLETLPIETLLEQRQQKLFNYGEFEE